MLKLASSIGLALALADLKRRVRYLVRIGVFGAVGGLFAIIALCFFLVAAHLYLSSLLNSIASAAIIGGVLLVVALILFFVASRPMRKRASIPAAAEPAASFAETTPAGMADFAQSLLRHPLFPAAAAALLAGFFLGRRSKHNKDRGRD